MRYLQVLAIYNEDVYISLFVEGERPEVMASNKKLYR